MSERFFSEEEIREMGKRTVDRLTEAIDAGDAEQAKKIANRMYNEFLGMHDLYRNWTTATLSEVGKRFGDEVLEEIMMTGVKACILKKMRTKSLFRCVPAVVGDAWSSKANTTDPTPFIPWKSRSG